MLQVVVRRSKHCSNRKRNTLHRPKIKLIMYDTDIISDSLIVNSGNQESILVA